MTGAANGYLTHRDPPPPAAAAPPLSAASAAAQAVTPAPTPTTFGAGQVTDTANRTWVMLTADHPAGRFIGFLEPRTARLLGAELVRLGDAGAIILPPPPPPPPGT